jgi:hypothetical protein
MRFMLKPNSGSTSAVVSENDGCLASLSLGLLSRYDADGDEIVAQDDVVHDSKLVGIVGLAKGTGSGIRSLRRAVFLSLLVQIFSLDCLSVWSASMSSEAVVGDWDIPFALFMSVVFRMA